MAWRLQLSDRAVRRLDILPGKPSLLAAWVKPDRVTFLDLQTGARVAEHTIVPPPTPDRSAETWQPFLKTLIASNSAALPCVRVGNTTVYSMLNGDTRLYRTDDGQVLLARGDREIRLEIDSGAPIQTVALDRTTGLIAILDKIGKLHIFQQHVRVGGFETNLNVRDDLQPELVIADGGASIFATDGEQIILLESSGRVRERLPLHYTLGVLACSPDGKLVVTSDIEASVIRIYSGADLKATHQRFAVDLLVDAKRAQHSPDSPTPGTVLSALSVNNKGVLGFALSGTICVTNLARLKSLPRPKAQA